MKMKIIFLVLFAALLSFGCSRKSDGEEIAAYQLYKGGSDIRSASSQREVYFLETADQYAEATEEEFTRNSTSEDSMSADLSNVERKLVKRADVRIRVENLEAADASVAGLLKKYDAYAASTVIQETSYYFSLRVPSRAYEIFLAEMNGIGRVVSRSESTEDVTLRYYDLEGRLETKRELVRTFQSYLRRANNIEEILKVEARISELQYDIEGTGKQLRDLANRIDYSTIELTILGPATATPSKNLTFGERIKQMFGNFGNFLSGMGLFILGFIIYCIPVLLLALFLFWLLFGRVGLLKKLWRVVMGKKQET
jgi:hypothetical protein